MRYHIHCKACGLPIEFKDFKSFEEGSHEKVCYLCELNHRKQLKDIMTNSYLLFCKSLGVKFSEKEMEEIQKNIDKEVDKYHDMWLKSFK